MERIQPMNDLQIQERVEDLAGKSARILDCEQNTLNQTEEVLLVNGVRISLAGEEGARIKKALIDGQVPPCDLVNNMLIRAGIENNPVELETTVNVKSSTKTLEHSQLRNSSGVLVDEKMREKEDEDEFRQVNVEIWNSATSPQMEGGPKNNLTQGKGRSPSPGDKAAKPKKSIFSPLIKKPAKTQQQNQQQQQQQPPPQEQQQQPPSKIKDNNKTANSRQQDQQKYTSVDLQKHQTSSEEQQQQQKGGQKPNNGNNKIWSFFLKGKSSKDSSRPEGGGKSSPDKTTFGIISCPDDKKKKNKSKTKSQPQEPNYDNIVRNSAAAMSSHPKFKSKQCSMIDPAVSLINVEIDGIPARVTYETFV